MYHKRIMAELKRLSSLDYLTEIPNRRTFDKVLDREWSRAQREGYSLAVAMIDIDWFKSYNDAYGHSTGDECLKIIARALKSVMRRAADFCARYGGEEFAVILPNTELEGARHLLEEFRAAIVAMTLKHAGAATIPAVTVSAGIAAKGPHESIGADELLRRVDKALYQAKRQGRDRIVLFSGRGESGEEACTPGYTPLG
jgi:diguanylate cyclase (GGDEF)-like protein